MKEKFIELLKSTNRPGIEDLISFLETSSRFKKILSSSSLVILFLHIFLIFYSSNFNFPV